MEMGAQKEGGGPNVFMREALNLVDFFVENYQTQGQDTLPVVPIYLLSIYLSCSRSGYSVYHIYLYVYLSVYVTWSIMSHLSYLLYHISLGEDLSTLERLPVNYSVPHLILTFTLPHPNSYPHPHLTLTLSLTLSYPLGEDLSTLERLPVNAVQLPGVPEKDLMGMFKHYLITRLSEPDETLRARYIDNERMFGSVLGITLKGQEKIKSSLAYTAYKNMLKNCLQYKDAVEASDLQQFVVLKESLPLDQETADKVIDFPLVSTYPSSF